MPADHRLGLHEDDDIDPSRPQAAEGDPEPAVGRGEPRPAPIVGERGELLSEGEVLENEFGVRSDC